MKKTIVIVVILFIAAAGIAHWYFGDRGRFTTEAEFSGLDRTVEGNELFSDHDPNAILRFDSAYRYLGGQKFILYGVADTEQHFFIETTSDDKLKSVYWVQYEAYLPGKSYTYDYDDSPLRVSIGDFEFYTDTAVFEFDFDKKRARGTDGAMARQFLASKGYRYPRQVGYARLVYLTDETSQKELMIIYLEDLSTHGFTANELEEGGTNRGRWPDIEQAMLDRIKASISVSACDSGRLSPTTAAMPCG